MLALPFSCAAWNNAPCRARCGPASAEQISPAILAVATLLIAFSLLFMLSVEWLQRRVRAG